MRYLGIFAVLVLAASLVLAAGVARADTPPSTAGWTLNHSVVGNNIYLSVSVDNAADLLHYNGFVTKSWGDVDLGDGVVVRCAAVGFDSDPIIKYSFAIDNNSGQTKNIYQSAVLQNLNITGNATGRATAGVTVTDGDGSGVSAAGLCGNGCFYRASYNNTQTSPQVLGDLVAGSLSAPADCGDARSQNLSWQAMNGPVYDMKAEYGFTLSAYDMASGTSAFTVVSTPEPGTIAAMLTGVLGLAGFALRRRKV